MYESFLLNCCIPYTRKGILFLKCVNRIGSIHYIFQEQLVYAMIVTTLLGKSSECISIRFIPIIWRKLLTTIYHIHVHHFLKISVYIDDRPIEPLNQNSSLLRRNKIKVLVLRQHRPLKISADGASLLPYRKQIVAAPYFWRRKNSNLTPNLSFQAFRWRGRVLTIVWMTDQSKTKVKIQHGYEWKHCPRQF